MKNGTYGILGAATDFLLTVLIAATVIFSVFFIKALLYPNDTSAHSTVIVTEPMPLCHAGAIREGDSLFDPISKRKVGTVSQILEFNNGRQVYYRLTFLCSVTPKSTSLRTANLWFYFKLSTGGNDADQQI